LIDFAGCQDMQDFWFGYMWRDGANGFHVHACADVDYNGLVLFPSDAITIVQHALTPLPYNPRYDLNSDGAILYATDAITAVKQALVYYPGTCWQHV
jgi:hypothetical protein